MTASPLAAASAAAEAPIAVRLEGRLLIVRFAEPQRVASWAIVGGGLGRARTVAWLQVGDAELRPPVDARRYLRDRLEAAGVPDAVGLLTSRDVGTFTDVTCAYPGAAARCVATVGLGNALRAGDLPGPDGRIGTINVLCHVSEPLSDEALFETMALAAEARALAVREAAVPSRRSGAPASGTGTDCIVIAAPARGTPAAYAGKHTVIGHVVGAAVLGAVLAGVERWRSEAGAR